MGLDIGSILGTNLSTFIGGLIDKFHLSPEKKAEFQALIEQHQAELDAKQLELQEKLQDSISREVEAASATIKAEAQSGDKYTSRARPTFMYIVNLVFLYNYLIAPLAHQPTVPLPHDIVWLFGVSITGYVGWRSFDKFMALPGESNVQLPGVKIGNKVPGGK